MDTPHVFSEPEQKVQDWRIEQFERLGFSTMKAVALDAAKVDLHKMADPVKAGCSLELALEILL